MRNEWAIHTGYISYTSAEHVLKPNGQYIWDTYPVTYAGYVSEASGQYIWDTYPVLMWSYMHRKPTQYAQNALPLSNFDTFQENLMITNGLLYQLTKILNPPKIRIGYVVIKYSAHWVRFPWRGGGIRKT